MKTAAGLFALLAAISTSAIADDVDPCTKFTWDVTRELAVMRQDATPSVTGKSIDRAPVIELEKLYSLSLNPQSGVTFPVSPGKPMLADGANAGIVKFHVTKDGAYRVAMTSGHWIDIVDGKQLISSRDFQGQRGCERPHKIVEFVLPAGHDLALQFSGATTSQVLVSITAVP